MLFKPEDLSYRYDPIQEAANILNESVYLDESESILSPVAIPVVENARIGACVVAFDDVERLAEDYGADYIDAMYSIAEANEIDMDHLAVSVPEWKIIAHPEVVNELSNVIVAPISHYHPIYQFCETCVDLALQEDDARFIDYFVETVLWEADIEAWKKAKKKVEEIKGKRKTFSSNDAYQAALKKAQAEVDAAKGKANPNLDPDKDANSYNKGNSTTGTKRSTKEMDFYNAEYSKMMQHVSNNPHMTDDERKRELEKMKNASDAEVKAAVQAHLKQKESGNYARGNEVKNAANNAKNDDAAAVPAETKSLLDRVKSAAKWPIEKISQAISSLKTSYQNLKNKIQNTAPENRTIFQKFMNLIMSAIDRLSNLLSSKQSEGATA